MPEYLAPGVYVEETSFRSKSIEGVSTSTAGFVGPAHYGPITGDPELLTSFADFERIYGGLEDLLLSDNTYITNYLAHAAHAFFDEGGQRLYVSRIVNFGGKYTVEKSNLLGYASIAQAPPTPTPDLPFWQFIARFPGSGGNIRLTLTAQFGTNVLTSVSKPTLTRVHSYDLVHVRQSIDDGKNWKSVTGSNSSDGLYTLFLDTQTNTWQVWGSGSEATKDKKATKDKDLTTFVADIKPDVADTKPDVADIKPDVADTKPDKTPIQIQVQIRPITVAVEAEFPSGQGFAAPVTLGTYSFDPHSPSALTTTFTRIPATHFEFLTTPFALELTKVQFPKDTNLLAPTIARALIGADTNNGLLTASKVYTLTGGNDGMLPTATIYEGDSDESKPHDFIDEPLQRWKNGLLAFEGIDDISIVAAPGYSALAGSDGVLKTDDIFGVYNALINHCEKMRYRIAILDMPPNQLISQALAFRNLRSSSYAALYYPWVTIPDPNGTGRLSLPPSGFIAGIYARNDTNRSISKAPANEVVSTAIDFEQRLNKAQQEVLNPAGVNCLRFFPGHGFLVWGARTISDDPEWKYVNLRRYFAYLEHSIDHGTQWVVFENNNRQLWDNVRHTIEDFLLNEWKTGSLMGSKPEEAYFVRCDLSTMTQNDLDNGRLVCQIGVAAVRPAEFVIFRIGQWTSTTGSR